jgi:hypothetical protein
MSTRPWLASAALALLLAAPAAAQESPAPAPRWDFFTGRREVFHPLLADPREIQITGSYYRLHGDNVADVALGHSWGMARWSTINRWRLQWNIEGMAYSRFKLSGAVNQFDTVDFFAQLPLEWRRDALSGRAMIFHQSSHLGDDYIRRTGNLGFRYSIDGVRGHLSYDLFRGLRLYGGPTYLLHTVPSPDRWMLQTGVELSGPALYPFGRSFPSFLYVASDLQSRQNVRWNPSSRTIAGLRVRFRDQPRAVRFQVGYFDGHSPYGQFFREREHYSDVSLAFEL